MRSRKRAAIAFGIASSLAMPLGGASSAKPAAAQGGAGGLNDGVFRDGEAGFVVSEIAYALGPDAKESGACPTGMTAGMRGLIDALMKTPSGRRQPGETEDRYERRMSAEVTTTADGRNICMNPALAPADPGWRMVSGRNLKVEGIDLDGRDPATGKKQAGTCSHEEFLGANGKPGVDNQFYRVVGCTTGFQSSGQGNGWQTEMLTGSWGILMALKGVDDLRDDPDVEVSLYANADPIQLSAARNPLPYASYQPSQDRRYRATTRGRIVGGVLTMDPVDVRFINVVNGMFDDRVLRAARVRLAFTPDGGMEGHLAGYTPVEAMYDVQYGARHSRDVKGDPAPEQRRVQTSVGRAGALGHSCNGAYHALSQAADGDRDPATGKCTSISTQYRIRLVPAFVVDAGKPASLTLMSR
ncbi:MAG: hypothetical protein ABW173_06600 [Sphingomonas sp.]